jgi:hypothetical protein
MKLKIVNKETCIKKFAKQKQSKKYTHTHETITKKFKGRKKL